MRLMGYSLAGWFFKWYTVRIRTWLGIYGKIYPFAFRSSLGLCPWELLQAKGYIWLYIPCLVLIRIQYATQYTVVCSTLYFMICNIVYTVAYAIKYTLQYTIQYTVQDAIQYKVQYAIHYTVQCAVHYTVQYAIQYTLQPWWRRFQALRYQECYRIEHLPSLTSKWLKSSPPNTGVDSSNPRGLKCDKWKVYVGSVLLPWLIPVVGFDCWQYKLKYTTHYIILNNGILKLNSLIFPRSEGYITQYTP